MGHGLLHQSHTAGGVRKVLARGGPAPRSSHGRISEGRAGVVVSFGRHGRSRPRSFPRKRESTPQAFGNALSSDWIRFRGNDRRFVRDDVPNDTTTRAGTGLTLRIT